MNIHPILLAGLAVVVLLLLVQGIAWMAKWAGAMVAGIKLYKSFRDGYALATFINGRRSGSVARAKDLIAYTQGLGR